MLCRIAYIALDIDDTIEYKVYHLIVALFDELIEADEMDPSDYPVAEVDENYKHR